MIPIGSTKIKAAIATHREKLDDILKKSRTNLGKIKMDFASHFNQAELAYLDAVVSMFKDDNFLIADQSILQQKASLLPTMPLRTILNFNGVETVILKKAILNALNYTDLRKSFFPKFYHDLGIKACVYCNALPVLSVKRYSPVIGNPTIRAKYELDHFLNKDEYPFLSVCVYNLYPVCGNCNRAKSVAEVDFKLYGDQPAKNYKFELSPTSLAAYLISRRSEAIKINFTDPDKGITLSGRLKSFQDAFNIRGIYETQADLAEELITKSQIYTEAYKRALIKSSAGLLSNDKLRNRLLIGNYTDVEDTHKRAMAKFVQDIAKQLKLIP